MLISESDLKFIKKLREIKPNVWLAGSFMLKVIGIIERDNKDIDVVIDQVTDEQSILIKEYHKKGGGNIDFLKKRYADTFDDSITYKGIPLATLESLIKQKVRRGVKKDFKDLNLIMKYILESDQVFDNKQDMCLTILNEIEDVE